MSKAIFWDRDGVINEVVMRGNSVSSPRNFQEFKILPGVKQALEECKSMGFLNIIITNQPDISRLLLAPEDLEKMHQVIMATLPVDDITCCPHDSKDNCACRKPKPGMILQEAKKRGVDLAKSYVIGDSDKDIGAGKAAGCKTFFIKKAYNKGEGREADFVATNLKETINIIKSI